VKEYDYEMLYGFTSTITDVVAFILGLLAWFLAAFLTIVTAMDVLFLTYPIFQDYMIRKWDHKKMNGIRLVSEDARLSLEESHSSGEHPLVLYLKKRIKTYLFAATLLVIIITGGDDLRMFIVDTLLRLFEALGIEVGL
jgi:cytochrome b subunit of formate dehydrogenase